MDLTGWLEYFTSGLATQMREVQERGERIIRRDALAQQHQFSERQRLAVGHLPEHETLNIQEFETLWPGVTRRTLQRELKELIEKRVLQASGATNRLTYRLSTGKS